MPNKSASQRQKFTGCKTTNVQSGYVGEVKKNLREGYGVYTYPNSFFRYEGEWHEGGKDGFGKLKMRDGSFYEGQFINGEIDGTGIRYWAHTDNTYEGQFENGEMCGMGVMSFGDGSLYEGAWLNNKMEGEGVLKGTDGSGYVGAFHLHKKHGEGKQIYSDTSEYNGGWINGMRHGHGVMEFYYGSVYKGQWRADQMNGEGAIVHQSGVTYEGMWINNRPALEPVELRIIGDESLTFDQNEVVFSLEVECRTADDEVTTENGRMFKVTAGVRIHDENTSPTKISSSKALTTPSSPSTTPVERRTTPFGFVIEPYPICCKEEKSFVEEILVETQEERFSNNTPLFVQADGQESETRETLVKEDNSERNEQDLSDSETPSADFPSVQPQTTVNGSTKFINLMLPTMPSLLTKSSTCFTPESKDSGNGVRSRKGAESAALKAENKKKLEVEKLDIRENSATAKRRKNKQNKVGEKMNETLNDVYCKPGEYVVIVEDVTSPPFLDVTLHPVYIYVDVQSTVTLSKSKIDKR